MGQVLAIKEVQPQAEAKPQKRRRDKGTGSLFLRGNMWWMQYQFGKRRIRESTGTSVKQAAKTKLNDRLLEIKAGLEPDTSADITVPDLADAFIRARRNANMRSIKWVERSWNKHLKPFFGRMLARQVKPDTLEKYREVRNGTAGIASVNRELAVLRMIFNHGLDNGTIRRRPKFPKMPKEPKRAGFVEEGQYATLCAHCSVPWLRALLTTAYKFGFRKSELLTMRVKQVNLKEGTIFLPPGHTKNAEARTVEMTVGGEVHTLLAACIGDKAPEDFVFTWPNGKPVRDFRNPWHTLCASAGVPGLLFHDLRRSAVRNMIRRGVSQKVAQEISGHLTAEIFKRYDITSPSDRKEAAQKMGA